MILVIDQDPILKYRPFPAETSNLLVQHWHELAASTIFYFLVTWLAPVINGWIFGTFYTEMDNKKRKVDFDIHIAAMAQAFVSIALCIPMFLHPSFTEDPIFGTYEFGGLVAAITTGYFVWDLLYCCIYHFDIYGFEYLFHASGALVVFVSTFRGFLQPLIPAFLVYELSTPFVNLHWFYTRGPKGFVSDRTFMINGALLMLTFFMARCVWGVYASVKAFQLCLAVRDQLPRFLMPIIFSLNLGFQFLNFFWFYKMVRIAVRKSKSKKE